ncbi:hypothetical protein GGI18_005211, partial [Coemansia linderi]
MALTILHTPRVYLFAKDPHGVSQIFTLGEVTVMAKTYLGAGGSIKTMLGSGFRVYSAFYVTPNEFIPHTSTAITRDIEGEFTVVVFFGKSFDSLAETAMHEFETDIEDP